MFSSAHLCYFVLFMVAYCRGPVYRRENPDASSALTALLGTYHWCIAPRLRLEKLNQGHLIGM